MPGLHLISGNRLETLAEECGSIFAEEPLPPFESEIIVLQSMGMMQWLSIQLAEKLGIWADFEFVLPNRMTGILMKSFFPGLGDDRFFDKEIMTWKTLKLIRSGECNPAYSELTGYIKGDNSGIRGFQLASRITDLFDQYMTFRPEMVLRWDRSKSEEGEGWQPGLWRELTADMTGHHPPAMLDRLFAGISEGSIKTPPGLPRRISLFGVSYLPLYHLNVLRAASNFCDVYLYMLNPCKEYWVDIMREKEISKLVMKSPIVAATFEEELHIERGNPLLSSMGRAGRDYFRFLYMSDIESGEEQIFEEIVGDSILHVIQGDILAMRGRGERRGVPPVEISESAAESDRSVTVNSCHSIMREVEVLHDYLLDLFDSGSGITPGDVLVMTPDIEECSSIIQGVFDRREDGIPRIPYRIADRKISKTSRSVEAFFRILSLPEGRFTSSEVMGILQSPDVMRRFSLSGDDCDIIGSWVRDTNIYWGIDSAFRGRCGLPEIHENTWSFGVERMLLGSVMYCEDETPLGILPYSVIEGGSMQVLGRFISFLKLLGDVYYMLLDKHTPGRWGEIFTEIAADFFEGDQDSSDDLMQIVKSAARLREIEETSGFSESIGLQPVKEFLEKNLSSLSAGRNFITGDLTFCEMLPMRSIPCRVICLIGMNEYSFPRKSRASGFDLIMKHPKTGDRSVRDEDRYLFLETVISARERLYISYTGQNITTNTDQNPSIVVSELLECIDETFKISGGRKAGELIFRKQRLQAYHPVYFTKDSGYFSYSSFRGAGAKSYAGGSLKEYSFYNGPLPPLTDDERSISINDLTSFLINPARYLITRRLGVTLDFFGDDYRDDEPFQPDSLERYSLDEKVFSSVSLGLSEEDIFIRAKAAGILPHGAAADIIFRRSFKKGAALYDEVAPLLQNPLSGTVEIGVLNLTLRGTYTLFDGRQVFHRTGALRPYDRLRAWLYHLALCAMGIGGDSLSTRFVTPAESVDYRMAGKCMEYLETVASLYEKGMSVPLPLFPESSYKFARDICSKDEDKAFLSAMGSFRGTWGRTDISDPYIEKLFGGDYRPGDSFIDAAKSLYLPMINHETEVQ